LWEPFDFGDCEEDLKTGVARSRNQCFWTFGTSLASTYFFGPYETLFAFDTSIQDFVIKQCPQQINLLELSHLKCHQSSLHLDRPMDNHFKILILVEANRYVQEFPKGVDHPRWWSWLGWWQLLHRQLLMLQLPLLRQILMVEAQKERRSSTA
jgi:hypothetical protein